MEACGIPISAPTRNRIVSTIGRRCECIYIRRDDNSGSTTKGSFKQDRFLGADRKPGWAVRLAAHAYRTIVPVRERHRQTGQAVPGAEEAAAPARHDCRTASGRDAQHHRGRRSQPLRHHAVLEQVRANQPGGKDKVFLLSLPSWIHGIIAPPPGYGMALLDWKSQETGNAGGSEWRQGLIADFAGDLHMGFAIRAGLAPPGADKSPTAKSGTWSSRCRLVVIYGMSKYGAAAQAGKSLAWAETTLAAYRHAYPALIECQENVAAQAMFDQRIINFFGWPMEVHAGTKTRTLSITRRKATARSDAHRGDCGV